MSSESIEERLARLENSHADHAKSLERHGVTLYGRDDDGGISRDFKALKDENRYLRTIYILGTALLLPWLNALLGKLGLGPIRLGAG